MKRIATPKTQEEWEVLASALIRANLKLARMNHIQLEQALLELGVEQSPKNISRKLGHGRFSAVFMLQVLTACGTEQLDLPWLRS